MNYRNLLRSSRTYGLGFLFLFLLMFTGIIGNLEKGQADTKKPTVKPTTPHTIRIYLVANPKVCFKAEELELSDLVLSTKPLISQKDIRWYDWQTHTMYLDPVVARRIRKLKGMAQPFVVVVDQKRLYLGAFNSAISSYIPMTPIINIGPTSSSFQSKDSIRIYPSPQTNQIDLRNDPKLRNALKNLKLLKKQPGAISPNPTKKPTTQPTTQPSKEAKIVSPTYELAQLIERYEKGPRITEQEKAAFTQMRRGWLNRKANGYTRWGSDKWMKDLNYYQSLATDKLAEECFSRSIFGFEMAIYKEPIVGFDSLSIFHNGFAELFKREDMWKGILHAYEYLSSKLDMQADLKQIVFVTSNLDELRKLYGLSPLREQVRGREKLFLAANLRVLKKFHWYLEHYDPKKLGTNGSPGFFGEPCSVAQIALMLAKQIDSKKYAEIEPAIIGVRWTKEQKVQDLKSFLDLVFVSLEGFVTEHDTK